MSRRMTISIALAATVLTFAACGRSGATSTTTSLTPQSTPSTSSTTARAVAVSVDTAATPKSWVPVAYGKAQISVPQSWLIETYVECNPTSQGFHSTTYGIAFVSGHYQFSPGECQGLAKNRALVPNTTSIGPEVGFNHSVRHSTVNGITVYWTSPEDSGFVVPSLQVEVSATGPLANRVLHTLTQSPRSVALAAAPPPPIPSSWHRVSFGGISVAVPREWPIQSTALFGLGYCGPYASLTSPPTVVFETGSHLESFWCPAEGIPSEVSPVSDGLIIDPGPYSPIRGVTSFGQCLSVSGMQVCPTGVDEFGYLIVAVHLPGKSQPVAVEIGLGGNGMVARRFVFDTCCQSFVTARRPNRMSQWRHRRAVTCARSSPCGVTWRLYKGLHRVLANLRDKS